MNISNQDSCRPIKLSKDKHLIFSKVDFNKLVIADLNEPKNRAYLTIESNEDEESFYSDLEILFFETLSKNKFLLLTSDGILHIFNHQNLAIEEEKTSDTLDFKGKITAVALNEKHGFLAVNQFIKVSKKSYRNVIKVFKLDLDKWIWVEFLSEVSSSIHQSNIEILLFFFRNFFFEKKFDFFFQIFLFKFFF